MPPLTALRGRVADWRLVRSALVAVALVIDLLIWGGDTQTVWGGNAPPWLIAVLLCSSSACLLIWRSPLLGYGAQWLFMLVSSLVPAAESFAGFLLALFLVARISSRRWAVTALIAAVVPLAVSTRADAGHFGEDTAFFLTVNIGLWLLLTIAVWSAGRAFGHSSRRLRTERQWAREAREEAIALERLRLSRELHDIVAHSLTGIILQAAGARAVLARGTAGKEELDTTLQQIGAYGEQSMRELHRMLGVLRASGASSPLTSGLDEVDGLYRAARESGLEVVARTAGEPVTADPSIAHTAYRLIQEGLSNALKHGGAGAKAEVLSEWESAVLTITVRSTTGITTAAVPSGGFGIAGLRERVSVCGGSLEAGPTAHGYLLRARLPLSGQSVQEQT